MLSLIIVGMTSEKFNFVTVNGGVAEVLIKDQIGMGGIDGAAVSTELAFLDTENDIERVDVKINSGGGVVMDALSIYYALLGMSTPTRALIEGIAASAAAILPMGADEIVMNEYSGRMMLHAVRDRNGGDEKGTKVFNEVIEEVLMKRTGWSRDKTQEVLSTDTWYTASEAQQEGLVDSIYDATEGVPDPEAMENCKDPIRFQQIVNQSKGGGTKADPEPSETQKTKVMSTLNSKLAGKFDLDPNADEAAFLSKVDELFSEKQNLESKVAEKDQKINDLESKVQTLQAEKGEKLIDEAVKAGKIGSDQKQQLMEDYKQNPEMVERWVASLQPKQPDFKTPGGQGAGTGQSASGSQGNPGEEGEGDEVEKRASQYGDLKKMEREDERTVLYLYENDFEVYSKLHEKAYGKPAPEKVNGVSETIRKEAISKLK